MREFIKLITEKVGDNLYVWDIECYDLDFLKSNFNDTRNIGIAYYGYGDDSYYKIFTSIKPRTKYIDTIYTTEETITEKDVIIIKKLILQINKRYYMSGRRAHLGETYYYINDFFNIVKAKETLTKEVSNIKIINIIDDFSFEEIINPVRIENSNYMLLLDIQGDKNTKTIILNEPKYKVTMNDEDIVLLDGKKKMSIINTVNLIYNVILEFKLGRYNGGNSPQNKNLLIVIDEPNASVNISIREWL